MKTIIKSTLMLIAAVLGISMTSCNSDSDVKDTVTTQSLSGVWRRQLGKRHQRYADNGNFGIGYYTCCDEFQPPLD